MEVGTEGEGARDEKMEGWGAGRRGVRKDAGMKEGKKIKGAREDRHPNFRDAAASMIITDKVITPHMKWVNVVRNKSKRVQLLCTRQSQMKQGVRLQRALVIMMMMLRERRFILHNTTIQLWNL